MCGIGFVALGVSGSRCARPRPWADAAVGVRARHLGSNLGWAPTPDLMPFVAGGKPSPSASNQLLLSTARVWLQSAAPAKGRQNGARLGDRRATPPPPRPCVANRNQPPCLPRPQHSANHHNDQVACAVTLGLSCINAPYSSLPIGTAAAPACPRLILLGPHEPKRTKSPAPTRIRSRLVENGKRYCGATPVLCLSAL